MENTGHLFPYEWTLKDASFTKDKGRVFSCFACGGGSTMGYKLAGFDVIGCNEIDPKMNACYVANHNPKFNYLEDIRTFKNRDDLPGELYSLDILDGSPPCSSFSMAGNREKDWGKEKKFKEGQSEQVLDTLFFDFIDLAKKLRPKVVIAENVKGLLQGDAIKYVHKIFNAFQDAGYRVDHKLLNASKMGVPQKRERVFFYAIRNDLNHDPIDLMGEKPHLDLEFNEPGIRFKKVRRGVKEKAKDNDILLRNKQGGSGFVKPTSDNKVHNTICGTTRYIDNDNMLTNNRELVSIGSFPEDYSFLENNIQYVIGMSVPPVMTAQIATRIYEQWLKPNKKDIT